MFCSKTLYTRRVRVIPSGRESKQYMKYMEAKGKYIEQSGEIQRELSMLKEKLKRHKASFKKESNNWGYIGSLGHVLTQLKEINSFLK